jgi:polyadenylation factor subunit 2
LVFAPSDSKFASASDDATIKIFDFASGVEESVLTGHQWEIRSLDWHPTKGLLVSGSKDHSVKLWDPRSGRCLTTLSSSKNQVSRTLFEKTEGLLLATSGRDQIIRIFDLRMMRDVFHLRGHENEITSLAWHPLHRNLISTGGHSGAIHHYLLDEQNPPPNGAFTLSPYDSPDPQNAPTQTIYPAHSVLHAHEPTGPIWAMSWHPLGHILASGSNDRVTRFWSRPRPGETNYLNDRFHIGPEAAEARGTYNKHDRRQQRDAEEQEEEDEAEGLAEQKVPAPPLQLPGMQFPGLGPPGLAQLPGFGSIAPPPNMGGIMPPPMPGPGGFPPMPPNAAQLQGLLPPGMDLEKLKEMFGGQLPPPPPNGVPLPLPGGFPPLPGMPGMPGMPGAPPPPGFMPGMMPPPFPPPQGGPNGQFPGLDADPNGVRRRAPLPSQEEAKRQLFGRR